VTTLGVFRLHLSVLLPNIETVPKKRQPGDSPPKTKHQNIASDILLNMRQARAKYSIGCDISEVRTVTISQVRQVLDISLHENTRCQKLEHLVGTGDTYC